MLSKPADHCGMEHLPDQRCTLDTTSSAAERKMGMGDGEYGEKFSQKPIDVPVFNVSGPMFCGKESGSSSGSSNGTSSSDEGVRAPFHPPSTSSYSSSHPSPSNLNEHGSEEPVMQTDVTTEKKSEEVASDCEQGSLSCANHRTLLAKQENSQAMVDYGGDSSSQDNPTSDRYGDLPLSSSTASFGHPGRAEAFLDASKFCIKADSKASDPPENSIYLQSFAFNQDNSCFVCATTAGFRVFTCTPLVEFMRRETPTWGEGCYDVVGMLFRTNVFALVSRAEPKKVKLWDDQKKRFIGELRSRQPVRNVCLGREILAMVTEYTIYVYQSEQMRPFNIIHTGSNPRGLCVVGGRDNDGWILACPAVAAGAVRIQTSEGDRMSHVFQAHQSPLAVLSFNAQGTLIATASEIGTVVRIFCAVDGQLLHELRRGTHSYSISCVAIRADDQFLVVASSSPTVHVFKLEQYEKYSDRSIQRLALLGSAERQLPSDGDGRHLSGTSSSSSSTGFVADNNYSSRAGNSSTADENPLGQVDNTCESSCRAQPQIPLQHALSAGKELTSVVYDASKEIVNDMIKGVFFKYFSAVRSFAQFHIPTDQQSIDVRSATSHIAGPLCAFAGEISNHIYLFHPNGVFYEFRFDPNYGDVCTLLTATTWFAPRPDFQLQAHLVTASLPSELEGGHEGDEWQIVM